MNGIMNNKKIKFIINVLFISICLVLAYYLLKYVPQFLLPFILSFIVVLITNPLVDLIVNKLKIPRKIAGPIVSIIAILLLCAFAYFFVVVVFGEIEGLLKDVRDVLIALPQKIEEYSGKYDTFLDRIELPEAIKSTINFNSIVETVYNSLVEELSLKDIVTFIVGNGASFVFAFFIFVVSTVLISADYIRIKSFVIRQFSDKHKQTLTNLNSFMKTTVWEYIKTYSLIFIFYFVSMYVLFLLMGIKRAALIAFLIGLVDLLPVVGLGVVLIPWSIISFISGSPWVGIILISSYIVLTLVRNFLEPKLLGKHVGLHPLVTLLALYIGLKLFGVIGVFVVPLVAIMIKSEHDAGRIKLWKD